MNAKSVIHPLPHWLVLVSHRHAVPTWVRPARQRAVRVNADPLHPAEEGVPARLKPRNLVFYPSFTHFPPSFAHFYRLDARNPGNTAKSPGENGKKSEKSWKIGVIKSLGLPGRTARRPQRIDGSTPRTRCMSSLGCIRSGLAPGSGTPLGRTVGRASRRGTSRAVSPWGCTGCPGSAPGLVRGARWECRRSGKRRARRSGCRPVPTSGFLLAV